MSASGSVCTMALSVRRTALLVALALAIAGCLSSPEVALTGPAGPTDLTGATGSTSTQTPPRVAVPDVVGMSIAEARQALQDVGLRPRVVKLKPSLRARGTVLIQGLDAGQLVRASRRVPLVVAKPEPAPPCGVFDNPWCYTFEGGAYISDPPADFCAYFDCIPSFWDGRGYVIQCQDGEFSKSGGISGSCSYHGGNWRYLYAP